jgi:hypothetical protein
MLFAGFPFTLLALVMYEHRRHAEACAQRYKLPIE